MVMIPPLLRDPSPDDRQGSTGRPAAARMVRTQRRYASSYTVAYMHQPPEPITKPGFPTPESMFDKWRAAAVELDPRGGEAAGPPGPAAGGEARAADVAAVPRRSLHDALLGTTAVLLLGVLGGIGYFVWFGAVPGVPAPGSGAAALVQPLAGLAAKAVTRAVPDSAPPVPPGEDAAAAPAPAVPAAVVAGDPAPAAAVAVPPVPSPGPGAVPPAAAVPDSVAPAVEQAATQPIPPAKPFVADAAPPAPSIAAPTVRLPPAPEWTAAPAPALASLPEAAAPPVLPAASAGSLASAEPAPALAEVAKAVPPGVDAQQVVSTMALVQRMSLLVHDMHGEGLRYRTEVTALTGAVQAKASGLEERLRLAEARSAAGAGVPASDIAGDGGGLRAAADVPPVLRGYRVQAGSPGAAVLSDVGAGPERVARLLVMVGDQLPGAGRVTAIVQRGRGWIVRTERGVIQ